MEGKKDNRTAGGNRNSNFAIGSKSSKEKEKNKIKLLLSRIAVQPQVALC